MQITREHVVGELTKLTSQKEQLVANANAIEGAIAECRAMLVVLDTPETVPSSAVDKPDREA